MTPDPLAAVPTAAAVSPRKRPRDEANRTVGILVIDDDDRARDLLSTALTELGYHVKTARTAEDALVRMLWEPFDLVLCDVVLPGMDGIALSRNLAESHPSVPVVLITGYSGPGMARSAVRQGAADFVPKPVSIRALPVVVERNLERRRIERVRGMEEGDRVMVQSIRALAAAIDAKEKYTAEHSRRVAAIVQAIGKAMDLPPTELRCLELAAMVHDVGKIAVPDEILNKAETLTDAEWEIMRSHAPKGAEIVGHVQELAYVADVVRHHHERMDGGGYPDGLHGDAIPLLARIIAAADAYEVMTSDRIYRAKRSPTNAFAELARCAGTQFDAVVVDRFHDLALRGIIQ